SGRSGRRRGTPALRTRSPRAKARARARGSSPPPEAFDHQPVGIDIVDTLGRAKIDDHRPPALREVVAVDDERDALPGDRARRALGCVDDPERARAADRELLRLALKVGTAERGECSP